MTIKDIMQIDPTRTGRAAGCSVNLLEIYHDIEKVPVPEKYRSMVGGEKMINTYYITLKFSVKSVESGKEHIVFIKLPPDFDMSRGNNSKVEVYCDCSDFMYRSAYGLGKNNALFLTPRIKVSLGQSMTDAPKAGFKTSNLCKHSYAALQWLMNNYSTVMGKLI